MSVLPHNDEILFLVILKSNVGSLLIQCHMCEAPTQFIIFTRTASFPSLLLHLQESTLLLAHNCHVIIVMTCSQVLQNYIGITTVLEQPVL